MGQILKKIFFAFSLLLFSFSYAQQDSSAIPFVQAQFPGGKMALMKYLKTNLSEKVTPLDNGLSVEKVIARFSVDQNGKIMDVKIIKTSGHQTIDKQFINVIYAMPKWIPAENLKGKKIGQEISLPISLCTR